MKDVQVRLFQTPSIHIDGKPVVFALKKAEALFFYLAERGRATRDELADLLWSDGTEQNARKNLRDVLYHVKKIMGEDILLLSGQQGVELDHPERIQSDLRRFLTEGSGGVEAYTGDFLKGLTLKDATGFEEWMLERREYYRGLYIEKLQKHMEGAEESQDTANVVHYADLLIHADGFNEEAYRQLMRAYAEKGAYGKAINTYQRLRELLARELGIAPDIQTRRLFQSVVEAYNRREKSMMTLSGDFFFGRQDELTVIRKEWLAFQKGLPNQSVLLLGEMGVGKSRLKDQFLKGIKGAEIISAHCHPAEQEYILKPWDRIFSQLEGIILREQIEIPVVWRQLAAEWFPAFLADGQLLDHGFQNTGDGLKYHVIENAVQGILRKVAQKQKLVLIFEDVQWMDNLSLSLMNGILAGNDRKKIWFLGTARDGYGSELEKVIISLSRQELLRKVPVGRFSRKDSMAFIGQALENNLPDDEIREAMYRESEGNAFFLTEYVNAYCRQGDMLEFTGKMKDILDSRLLDVSDGDRKLLDIAAMFFDEVSVTMLQNISGQGTMAVLEFLERLKHKLILRETGKGDTWIFTHQKLREYIYQKQSLSKRRILHNNIALIMESALCQDERDAAIYPILIHHFTQAGNLPGAIRYSIHHVKRYLDYSDELFPEWRSGYAGPPPYIEKRQVEEWLERIGKLVEALPAEVAVTRELEKLVMIFHYIRGRYRIREGDYENGTAEIQLVIDVAWKLADYVYVVQGYKELVYHAVRIHDIPRMENIIELALQVAVKEDDRKELAVLYRLKALMRIMEKRYGEAEELLQMASGIFSEMERSRYALNIAACYSYMGDIRRYQGDDGAGLEYYHQAISLADNAHGTQSPAIFHNNAGQAAFYLGKWDEARSHFMKAVEIYNLLDSGWGRAIAEGYMSLLCCRSGEYIQGLRFLQNAEVHSLKSRNPYELGLLYRIKAEIRRRMEENPELEKHFASYLPLEVSSYCKEGMELLHSLHSGREMEFLTAFARCTDKGDE